MSGSNTKMELSWDTKATARVIQFVLPFLKQKENTYLVFLVKQVLFVFYFQNAVAFIQVPVNKSAEPLRIRNLKSFNEYTNKDEN